MVETLWYGIRELCNLLGVVNPLFGVPGLGVAR